MPHSCPTRRFSDLSHRRRSKVLSVIASRRAVSCLLGSPLGNCPTNASRTFREKRLDNRNERYLTAISSSIVANSSFADGPGASSTSAGHRIDRKSDVSGKSVTGRLALGGRSTIKTKNRQP